MLAISEDVLVLVYMFHPAWDNCADADADAAAADDDDDDDDEGNQSDDSE